MVPEGWSIWKLGEVTDNFDFKRVPVKKPDRRPGPYPYYGASGVVDHTDEYLFEGEYLLIAEDGENLRSRRTPVAFLADGKFWVNNHAHIVRGNERANTRYIAYALEHSDISGYLSGSTMPKLTQGNMNQIPLLLPPKAEQDSVVELMRTFDDKIELNRRMNETLEAMARAIFKSWFVDFDPVRAKMERREPVGLSPEIAALFPDSFEDSELGEIPKGWRVDPLTALATLQTESIKPYNFSEQTWEHYSIPAFENGRRPVMERGDAIKSGKYAVPESCVLVSKLNPQFPRVWLPDLSNGYSPICSTEFMVFVPNNSNWRYFLYRLAKSELFQREISNRVTGSTGSRQRVKPKEMTALPIIFPPPDLIDAFSETCGSLIERELANIREQETLAATRDTLLPKLLSGELAFEEAAA